MSKKKEAIQYDATDVVDNSLMSFPGDLNGLLHDVNGTTENPSKKENAVADKTPKPSPAIENKSKFSPTDEVESPDKDKVETQDDPKGKENADLWNKFTAMCEEDKNVQKKMGRGNLGTSSTVRVEKDLLEVLRLCPVDGHSITTMVNSIIRVFFLSYKDNFKKYQTRTVNKLLS